MKKFASVYYTADYIKSLPSADNALPTPLCNVARFVKNGLGYGNAVMKELELEEKRKRDFISEREIKIWKRK